MQKKIEFSKYIVPVFINDKYYGTGFVVNDMLITANHVVKNKLRTYFEYEGKRFHVDFNKIVVDLYENRLLNNQVQDLFVCKIDIEDSNLEISSEFDKNGLCEFFGYSSTKDDCSLSKDYMPNIVIHRNVAINSDCEKVNNCFSCKCKLKHTNSGAPLFQNGKVIGMLIWSIEHYGGFYESVFIKMDYIIDEIRRNLTYK